MERHISRSELQSAESTPPASPNLEDIEKLKNFGSFEFINVRETREESAPKGDEDDEEQAIFQLFAPTKTSEATNAGPANIQKIRLKSPTPISVDAGFVTPNRDISYYLATGPTEEEKARITASATTGQEILARSQSKCPGLAYPWKVTSIPQSSVSRKLRSSTQSTCAISAEDDPETRHKRKGKKARIKIRARLAAEKDKAAEAKIEQESKEAAEREKKTRRNREKKMKRKLKEKAEKAKKNGAADTDGSADEMEVEEG